MSEIKNEQQNLNERAWLVALSMSGIVIMYIVRAITTGGLVSWRVMAVSITFEIILDTRTLQIIKALDLNLPQAAIEGILAAIDREQSVRHVVSVASTQNTIEELSAALRRMRERADRLQVIIDKQKVSQYL